MFKKYLFLGILLFNQAVYSSDKKPRELTANIEHGFKHNPHLYFGYEVNKQFKQLQNKEKENLKRIMHAKENPLSYKIAGSLFFGTIGAITGAVIAEIAPHDYEPYVFGACTAAGAVFGWRICKYSYIPAVKRKDLGPVSMKPALAVATVGTLAAAAYQSAGSHLKTQ